MYPLKFKPVYFEKRWGGRGLEKFKKHLPKGKHRRKLGIILSQEWD